MRCAGIVTPEDCFFCAYAAEEVDIKWSTFGALERADDNVALSLPCFVSLSAAAFARLLAEDGALKGGISMAGSTFMSTGS